MTNSFYINFSMQFIFQFLIWKSQILKYKQLKMLSYFLVTFFFFLS